jgi:hypothetical protein
MPRSIGSPRTLRALAAGLSTTALAAVSASALPAQDSTAGPRVGDRVRLTSEELWKVPRSPLSYSLLWPLIHQPRERRVGGTVGRLGDSVAIRTFGSLVAFDLPRGVTISTRSVSRWEVSRGRHRVAGAAFGLLYGVVAAGLLQFGCEYEGGGCSTGSYAIGAIAIGTTLGALRAPDRWQRVAPPVPAATR